MAEREDYTPVVGFAREPADERRRWVARIVLALFVIFIVWLGWTRVIHPPQDNLFGPGTTQTELPAPE